MKFGPKIKTFFLPTGGESKLPSLRGNSPRDPETMFWLRAGGTTQFVDFDGKNKRVFFGKFLMGSLPLGIIFSKPTPFFFKGETTFLGGALDESHPPPEAGLREAAAPPWTARPRRNKAGFCPKLLPNLEASFLN